MSQLSEKLAGSEIPHYMHEGIIAYVEEHRQPGSFLQAIFSNDLKLSCELADEFNKYLIFQYVQFLYNYTPSACWGSKEKYESWLENKEVRHG